MAALSELSVSRVAGILTQSDGITLREISQDLGVSRQTAIRWVTLMELDGLLNRSYRLNGRKGRPLGIYRPTKRLLEFLRVDKDGSAVLVNFSMIASVCRYNSNGECNRNLARQKKCDAGACPLLLVAPP